MESKRGDRPVRPDMCTLLRFAELSVQRQLLVRLCQTTNYGYIQGLEVKDSEPILNPSPRVWVEIKLDKDETTRREIDLADFALPDEICRLMARLDQFQNGPIERIEVRAGIPCRLVFERRLEESRR